MCWPILSSKRRSKKAEAGRPSGRAAYPQARVELWAVDFTNEHRIGLKPILKKVWCFDGQRPAAPVQHRYGWRYLVGFVHPTSGRTVLHLATSVSISLFEVELAEFARQVGASPHKQIVLVLDRAGWHASATLRVPEQSTSTCCSCRRIRLSSNLPSISGRSPTLRSPIGISLASRS